MSDSVLYTVGTALNRAHDNGARVHVLVEGQWLEGQVAAVDGHGVVLQSEDGEHSVIRMASVAAVRMYNAAPQRAPLPAGAMPMPAA